MASRGDVFATVTVVGSILPADMLQRIATSDRRGSLAGLEPEDYHLVKGERFGEVISRSWTRMLAAWTSLKDARAKLPPGDPATGVTRERWLLVLFDELGYGRLRTTTAFEIEGKTYPVSHLWGNLPIHLLGCGVSLDARTQGVAGASRMSPHSMLQELLNRSERFTWGILSNGLRLRILRESVSLTRQSYIEFDLEAMMEGEVYSDFVLLWLLCHESRFEAEKPEDMWIERWSRTAADEGIRALDDLRRGVKQAIEHLGSGFLAYSANGHLREKLRSGAVTKHEFYRQVLRVVYRLIFLFAAEDRDLLLDPAAPPEAKDRYMRFYSASHLRALSEKKRGTSHPDLYRGFKVVARILGGGDGGQGCPALALPALGSFLWSNNATPDLDDCDIANEAFLDAIRALSSIEENGVRRRVDYKNLGSEEIGGVYESLLELHPDVDIDSGRFTLIEGGGNERKTTGSYYTPTKLIDALLDSALEPVLDEAVNSPDPKEAILNLKVCDPACGSGHFLIAAAHRIAGRLASVMSGGDEPSPQAYREALRNVIRHCIYGVDLNDMAVELCRINLWMESMVPGKPLSFLAHRIKCGNSLIGAPPAVIAKGIPDAAFEPIEGDDKKIARLFAAQNRREAGHAVDLFSLAARQSMHELLVQRMRKIDAVEDESVEHVRQQERMLKELLDSAEYRATKLVADAWCAAFVWRKAEGAPPPVTNMVLSQLKLAPESVPEKVKNEIRRLAESYKFFHWHIEFPEVFRVPRAGEAAENPERGWSGGFDVVLGNPPWERVKLQEQEWFAQRNPDIANAPNAAARKRMIEKLSEEDPALARTFEEAKRQAEGTSHFLRNSGVYPLCGRGDINTYAVFAELNRSLMGPRGRVGCIVPSGIATDDTTKFFFQDIMERRALVSLYDFENRKGIFPGIHRSYKFCLLTLTGRDRPAREGARFVFFAWQVEDLEDEERAFTLTAEDLKLLNPNTRTCPVFRSRRDAEITKGIYRRVPVLIKEGPPEENPWGIKFMAMFHMANDSGLFRTREELEADGWVLDGNVFRRGGEEYLPLYEAKMIWYFDHRFGTYERTTSRSSTSLPTPSLNQYLDPSFTVLPWYWVPAVEVQNRLDGWKGAWLMAFRDVTNSTNERTLIASVIPMSAVGNNAPLILPDQADAHLVATLVGNLSSYILDYVARIKVGGMHANFFIVKQLPVFGPQAYRLECLWDCGKSYAEWLFPRLIELIYTSHDIAGFARWAGYDGPPFKWDEERRFQIRCELDAAYFHMYGVTRDDVEYIMDTFPVVKRNDEAKYGCYRTKELILEIYDRMAEAARLGQRYQTILDPPPGDPRCTHGGQERVTMSTDG